MITVLWADPIYLAPPPSGMDPHSLPQNEGARKLTAWLEANGLQQKQFGYLIGAAQCSVSLYCTSQRIPHRKIMARIVEATGGQVTADDFYKLVAA